MSLLIWQIAFRRAKRSLFLPLTFRRVAFFAHRFYDSRFWTFTHRHSSSFHLLPDPVWRVEAERLEREHEWDPLVIGVVDGLILLGLGT